ncbi:MAG: pantothenate kinase [Candidatus Methanomethylophilaceae archaeon]|jgi:pantoate kinase|nr:pantothenate kinase [Candidatus Methanomethylophilaceae archaeon]
MTRAFCPGHVSCIFQPSRSPEIASTGSCGVGIRLGLGAHAKVLPRSGRTAVCIDGAPSEAPVTRLAAEILAPGKGFLIEIENDIPVSQGFGMSAAGAVAAALCIADIEGRSREEAMMAAHEADIRGGGGMGDVAAIAGDVPVPVRRTPGMPPFGIVEDAGIELGRTSFIVLGPKMATGPVLSDPERFEAIRRAAASAMEGFLADPSPDSLYRFSNEFSERAGVEGPDVASAIAALRSRGHRAGMCMLGNSVFTDAPLFEARRILGRRACGFSCAPSGESARVIRTG